MHSVDAFAELADDSLDWIYLDGDNRYNNLLNDLRESRRVVKPGGVIAGHGYLEHLLGGVPAGGDFLTEHRDMCIVMLIEDGETTPSYMLAEREHDARLAKQFGVE
jgi:hypothetical protein